jgi:hypothetical protein
MLVCVPTVSIAKGTEEIQRNIIAERVLELPEEPRFDILSLRRAKELAELVVRMLAAGLSARPKPRPTLFQDQLLSYRLNLIKQIMCYKGQGQGSSTPDLIELQYLWLRPDEDVTIITLGLGRERFTASGVLVPCRAPVPRTPGVWSMAFQGRPPRAPGNRPNLAWRLSQAGSENRLALQTDATS